MIKHHTLPSLVSCFSSYVVRKITISRGVYHYKKNNNNVRIHNGSLVQFGLIVIQSYTRTTRMPVFWGYPSHIGSQVKARQSQSYKFKEFASTSIFLILKKKWHETHLLKLLDKMCKYEMDPVSIEEGTEWTGFCPQAEGQTDRWTDKVKPVFLPSTSLRGVIRYQIQQNCNNART